ncbi:hypothetical protein BDZ94DRAFT_1241884 [Collybia nuda]|uniref:Uncharacterized protein n=1 Tax=Collybia nuda TaxID=64659 RepID=A0A9P6C8G9_9AGAR|nr:hypothetical protein BDZ94DRAFT_1241884 [Collybia nuda]
MNVGEGGKHVDPVWQMAQGMDSPTLVLEGAEIFDTTQYPRIQKSGAGMKGVVNERSPVPCGFSGTLRSPKRLLRGRLVALPIVKRKNQEMEERNSSGIELELVFAAGKNWECGPLVLGRMKKKHWCRDAHFRVYRAYDNAQPANIRHIGICILLVIPLATITITPWNSPSVGGESREREQGAGPHGGSTPKEWARLAVVLGNTTIFGLKFWFWAKLVGDFAKERKAPSLYLEFEPWAGLPHSRLRSERASLFRQS